MRENILFDEGWIFHRGDIKPKDPEIKGPMYMGAKTERYHMGPAAPGYAADPDCYRNTAEYKSERWDRVTLPHDYLVSDRPDIHNNNALGFVTYDNAWYRKTFRLPAEDLGRRITLLFEGVTGHATVYLNGCLLKHNFCGYTSFEVDITDYAKYGEDNILAVYVNVEEHEGWWYEGAGIYRHVRLIKTSPVAVDLWGVYVLPEKRADGNWDVKVETTVRNDTYAPVAVRVETDLVAPDGSVTASAAAEGNIGITEKAALTGTVTVASPVLWDPDTPALYTAVTRVYIDGDSDPCDETGTRFGFRTVVADPDKGLFINGKHTILKGVCGHESFGLTGKACPDNLCREKVLTLREMGANAYRTSHYPQSEALMDAFDEFGFLVMDETRWFDSTEEGLEQLTMLLKRDRNRPSVIMWSLGNEEPLFVTEQGRRICRKMSAHVRKLDSGRFILTANDKSPTQATVYDECDLVAINYNLQIYDEVRKQHPNKAFFSSECCATGTTRGWYYPNDPAHAYINAYDKDANNWFLGREKTWKFLMERPWVMGGFQWHAYEYRGESEAWPRLCSVSGAIDLFWQKKDAFYQNQSHWTEEPMIHLLPHWNFTGREGEMIRVVAYTNGDAAELFLDGKSLGSVELQPYDHAEWQVPFTPGRLEAVAYRDGKPVARDVRETSGRGERLVLELMNHEPLRANGKDIALVSCKVIDADGREVPTAAPFLRFTTGGNGRIYSTGSDNTDHESIYTPDRRMYAGRATAAVLTGTTPGKMTVYAESDGLVTASLTIELQ